VPLATTSNVKSVGQLNGYKKYGFHEIICSYFNLEESFLKPKVQMCRWLQEVM
jgi:hypothetical protein